METILIPELSPVIWEPKAGDLAVNFGTPVRILEIGYTDSFGTFNADMIKVKIIAGGGRGQCYYAHPDKLQPAI